MAASTANFAIPPTLAPFTAPFKSFRDSYDSETGLIVGAFIFSSSGGSPPNGINFTAKHATTTSPASEPRLLLLQRATSDTFGDLWDFPGGSCEPTDATLLESLKREVLEETGLTVLEDGIDWVGMCTSHVHKDGTIEKWAKFSFTVKIAEQAGKGRPEIELAPEEHRDFVWATEGDVEASLEGREGAYKFIAIEEIELAAEAFRKYKGSKK